MGGRPLGRHGTKVVILASLAVGCASGGEPWGQGRELGGAADLAAPRGDTTRLQGQERELDGAADVAALRADMMELRREVRRLEEGGILRLRQEVKGLEKMLNLHLRAAPLRGQGRELEDTAAFAAPEGQGREVEDAAAFAALEGGIVKRGLASGGEPLVANESHSGAGAGDGGAGENVTIGPFEVEVPLYLYNCSDHDRADLANVPIGLPFCAQQFLSRAFTSHLLPLLTQPWVFLIAATAMVWQVHFPMCKSRKLQSLGKAIVVLNLYYGEWAGASSTNACVYGFPRSCLYLLFEEIVMFIVWEYCKGTHLFKKLVKRISPRRCPAKRRADSDDDGAAPAENVASNVYMDFRKSLTTALWMFAAQAGLLGYLAVELNGWSNERESPGRDAHVRENFSLVKWFVAIVVIACSGSEITGAYFHYGFWWTQKEKLRKMGCEGLEEDKVCLCQGAVPARHVAVRCLMDFIVNQCGRAMLQGMAPMILACEGPLDFVKDATAMFIVIALDDISSVKLSRSKEWQVNATTDSDEIEATPDNFFYKINMFRDQLFLNTDPLQDDPNSREWEWSTSSNDEGGVAGTCGGGRRADGDESTATSTSSPDESGVAGSGGRRADGFRKRLLLDGLPADPHRMRPQSFDYDPRLAYEAIRLPSHTFDLVTAAAGGAGAMQQFGPAGMYQQWLPAGIARGATWPQHQQPPAGQPPQRAPSFTPHGPYQQCGDTAVGNQWAQHQPPLAGQPLQQASSFGPPGVSQQLQQAPPSPATPPRSLGVATPQYLSLGVATPQRWSPEAPTPQHWSPGLWTPQ